WKSFGQGTIEFLQPENRKVLAFIRRHENETILVLANLSRFTQPAELDLAAFKDLLPIELFGRTPFPVITEKPYFVTLGPHTALWFSLEPAALYNQSFGAPRECETIPVRENWEEVLEGKACERFVSVLGGYLQARRWIASKGRQIKTIQVRETIPVPFDSQRAVITIIGVEYTQGDPEEYLLPLAFARDKV